MRDFNTDPNDIRDIYMHTDSTEKKKQADRAIPKLLGSVGAIAFVLGLIIMAVADKVNIFALGLSGVGLLLLLVFVAIDFSSVKSFLTSRSTVYSTNLSIVMISLFGIIIVINAFAANHYFAIDMTKNRDNSLSNQTVTILQDIGKSKRKVEMTAFIRNDDARRIPLKMLLDRYEHVSPTISFSFVDYEIRKKLAIEKGIQSASILIESDGTSQIVHDFDERSITAGILKMLHPDQTVIGMLVGHGEFMSDGTGGRSIAKFIEQLEKENYIVKPVDLSTSGGVPLEISTIMIVAPKRPLNEKELASLNEFAERGGSLALFLEPFNDTGLTPFLSSIGIENLQNMIIDPGENYFQDETIPVIKTYLQHPITQGFLASQAAEGGFSGGLIIPTATGLRINEKLPDSVKTEPLAMTSDVSWGETSADVIEFTQGEDTMGPLTVAVVGTKSYSGDEETAAIDARFMVVGDADFLTDASIEEGSNFNFAMNSVNWLSDSENLMEERPRIAEVRAISLEPGQSKAIQIITLLLPLSIALLGIVMWVKRR